MLNRLLRCTQVLQHQAKITSGCCQWEVPDIDNGWCEQVVYEWAQGTAFEDICKLTDVQEGIIVRTIVRLDETCREFRDAARVMGNTQLFQQMSEASAAIKRDVIFAASLYVA